MRRCRKCSEVPKCVKMRENVYHTIPRSMTAVFQQDLIWHCTFDMKNKKEILEIFMNFLEMHEEYSILCRKSESRTTQFEHHTHTSAMRNGENA